MGCHIDGYIAVTAHTVVVPDGDSPVVMPCPEAGDVQVACYNAMKIASALIRPGVKNTEVTKAVEAVADAYGVKCIANVRMHQMKQYVIDGKKEIALTKHNPEKDEQKTEEVTFEENEVYAIDVCMSTGEGEGRIGEDRCTVYKRNVETKYQLRSKNSRALLTEVNNFAGTMAFTLRSVSTESIAKAGIIECASHNLFTSYPVFNERNGVHVAHFKTTLLVLPSGNKASTGLPLPAYFTSEKTLGEAEATILAAEAEKVAAAAAKKAKKAAAKKKGKK
jgi:curved DNA binding protein